MKFKYGDILVDATDTEDSWEVIFINYEQDHEPDEYMPGVGKILDCVVGIFGTEDNITGMYSKNLWYKSGRHVLTEVCDV